MNERREELMQTLVDLGQAIDAPAESARKLATVRRIAALDPIEGADRIVCATVDGWQLVTAKDNGFEVGDLCLYFEIDSWVPTSIAPFLTRDGHVPKEYNGVQGERLRTKKLKGQVSQGLILPLDRACGEPGSDFRYYWGEPDGPMWVEEGTDLTEVLGVQKYEKPVPANLAGQAKGNFPSFIPKTDEERIQNLTRVLDRWCHLITPLTWEVTEKMDGSSMTVYFCDNNFGVCSRNFDLIETPTNSFWQAARDADLRNKMTVYGRQLAIQGELIGPGVQGNKYQMNHLRFKVFNIYDIEAKKYLSPSERKRVCLDLELDHVPVLHEQWFMGLDDNVELYVLTADGDSLYNPKVLREGLVWKCWESPSQSFKAISNKWLLKHE
jgi:RNA ligase (TIGR02306 family)